MVSIESSCLGPHVQQIAIDDAAAPLVDPAVSLNDAAVSLVAIGNVSNAPSGNGNGAGERELPPSPPLMNTKLAQAPHVLPPQPIQLFSGWTSSPPPPQNNPTRYLDTRGMSTAGTPLFFPWQEKCALGSTHLAQTRYRPGGPGGPDKGSDSPPRPPRLWPSTKRKKCGHCHKSEPDHTQKACSRRLSCKCPALDHAHHMGVPCGKPILAQDPGRKKSKGNALEQYVPLTARICTGCTRAGVKECAEGSGRAGEEDGPGSRTGGEGEGSAAPMAKLALGGSQRVPDQGLGILPSKDEPWHPLMVKLYVVGGCDGSNDLNSMECFDLSTGHWSVMHPMGTARARLGVAVVDGKLYTVGGYDGSNIHSSVECFDLSTGQWSVMPAMGTARYAVGVAVLDGKLYAVGGHDGSNKLSSMECFDPSTGQWSVMPTMGTARSMLGVAVLDGKLYAVGGKDDDASNFLSSMECFDRRVPESREYQLDVL